MRLFAARRVGAVTEQPEKPFVGPENAKLAPRSRPGIKPWRSVLKAVTWRTVGTLDTFLLSYLLITYLGPLFGSSVEEGAALETASYIAITEVATKFVLYFLHERAWSMTSWGSVSRKGRNRDCMRRTAVKTGLWRTIASLDTFLLAWFFTGNVATALSIGGLEIFSKLILYFLHERIWARLSIGLEPTANQP